MTSLQEMSELRSSHRFHALDETGLFGCACRHNFPSLFIDMKHGERYIHFLYTHYLCHGVYYNVNLGYHMLCGYSRK